MGVLGAQYMYLFGADAINPHPKALGHFGRFGFRARAGNGVDLPKKTYKPY